ncbi:TPA: hypothetical protein N0F65_003505 [Lagenidium giganteum]|uniref:Transposase Tc1-like domain-containing protein n=1 Tax=Lagenidium giganteum TaxID=4803 RepID=A0AAV2YPC1_9STRA|nr:TPA: hypothetical protein N0F65_003504 [Lagenidium giganteum]DAZ94469.1 TPA: hypothetical protein N0F65_003505 [Lagenidium giganteum]
MLPVSTIRNIIVKYKKHGFIADLPRPGRPPLADRRPQSLVVREVLRSRKISSAALAQMLHEHHQITVSEETVRQILHHAGLHGRAARKKSYISAVNKKKRLDYAKKHVNLTLEQWKNVHFTDESKFNVGASDGRVYVWRRASEEYLPDCLVPTFKSGVKVGMVLGWITHDGVGVLHVCKENVTADYYKFMLEDNLPQTMANLSLNS